MGKDMGKLVLVFGKGATELARTMAGAQDTVQAFDVRRQPDSFPWNAASAEAYRVAAVAKAAGGTTYVTLDDVDDPHRLPTVRLLQVPDEIICMVQGVPVYRKQRQSKQG